VYRLAEARRIAEAEDYAWRIENCSRDRLPEAGKLLLSFAAPIVEYDRYFNASRVRLIAGIIVRATHRTRGLNRETF